MSASAPRRSISAAHLRAHVLEGLDEPAEIALSHRADLRQFLQPLRVAIENRLRIRNRAADDRVHHLFRTELDAHARAEAGVEQAAIRDAVVTPIVILGGNVNHFEPRIERSERLDQIDNPQVLICDVVAGATNVGILEEVNEGTRTVTHVQERPPLHAVTEDLELTVQYRLEAEDIGDEIEPHARREPEERAVAKNRRRPVRIGQFTENALGG